MRVLVHGRCCFAGGGLTEIEEVALPILHTDEHEAAAAEVTRGGVYYRECESRGYRCVDGVSAGLHHFDTRSRGQLVDTRHHAVIRDLGVHASTGKAQRGEEERGDERQCGVSFGLHY